MSEQMDAEAIYGDLLKAVRASMQATGRMPAIVGIHSGGAWIAERLHADLGSGAALGYLSSAFHRDDYAARGLRTGIDKSTQIGFDVEGAEILLVDDILYTGRTVRAALNEIFDYGRPKRVELAALLDRGGRELPVQPDYVGAVVELKPDQQFVLERTGDGLLTLAIERTGS
jgi:pyrimidine operon attenuation protein / uracil phosphoribosyltransferase